MSINNSLDEINNILAGAWRIPMTKGKCAVSVDKIQNLIDDIRLALPKEIKQAKIILEDRSNILENAKQAAKNIIQNAQKQANYIVSETNIIKQAKRDSTKILRKTQSKVDEMLTVLYSYAEDLKKKVDAHSREYFQNVKDFDNEINKFIRLGRKTSSKLKNRH